MAILTTSPASSSCCNLFSTDEFKRLKAKVLLLYPFLTVIYLARSRDKASFRVRKCVIVHNDNDNMVFSIECLRLFRSLLFYFARYPCGTQGEKA
jgi:hypothetical protein